MRLVYIISKHTSPNSSYKLHIPNSYKNDMPLCGAKSFSIEFTEGDKPTCKKCLKYLNETRIYEL